MDKLKVALYWGASCGGCEVAVLDVDEKILEFTEVVDIVLWPVATDFKYKDVYALKDGEIDITLFNGAIRNSENEHMAHTLRKKSKFMVAFGACAVLGGIPGLANLSDRERVFKTAYSETDSTENPDYVVPETKSKFDGHDVTLPKSYDTVYALDQIVDVDYFVPGCPPMVPIIASVMDAIIAHVKEGAALPPKGTVFASEKSLCHDCPREKKDKKISKFIRPHELVNDTGECFLDQGVICSGPATRGGCGSLCINANMPCRGCMGPTPAVLDHGGSLLSAVASIAGLAGDETKMSEDELVELMDGVCDPAGLFYRFSLSKAIIKKSLNETWGGEK